VAIGARVIDGNDETLVLDIFKIQASKILDEFETSRGQINVVAGACSKSALVTTKANQALKLIDDANLAIKSMLGRLPAQR
jgi:hypothetical protein